MFFARFSTEDRSLKSEHVGIQDIVKALFADQPFNEKYHLGAVNSINWARILAQTVYYFLAYFHVRDQIPHPERAELQFVVPTGNFGDVLAGYYAKRMGLPMGKLVVATNSNDILARFWRSGRYERTDSTLVGAAATATAQAHQQDEKQADDGSVRATWSPAMDILVSSNFERLLWYLSYETSDAASDGERRASAGATIGGWMKSVKSNGRVEVPVEVLELARRSFLAERVSDDQVCLRVCMWPLTSFNADHLSDSRNDKTVLHRKPSIYSRSAYGCGSLGRADSIYQQVRLVANRELSDLLSCVFISSPSVVQVVLSTAHPAKFSEAVTKALSEKQNFNFERDVLPQEFRGLLEKERNVIDVDEPREELVKNVIQSKVDLHASGV